MKERPILFSGPMVQAILEGRKTQTRRLVKPQPVVTYGDHNNGYAWKDSELFVDAIEWNMFRANEMRKYCPYGAPGDRLWVRETWALVPRTAYAHSEGVQQTLRPDDNHDAAIYKADWTRCSPGGWRSPRFMPRWASRLSLEVVGVRVERLQEISEEDVAAEGISPCLDCDAYIGLHREDQSHWRIEDFADLWDDINGKRAPWASNPWVWVVEFRRLP